MSRKQIYEKIFKSDIFNNDPSLTTQVPKVHIRESQPSLTNTKNNIFNTEKKVPNKEAKAKIFINRKLVYSKIYGSDIFNQTIPVDKKNNESIKKKRNANNYSSCFDNMKNNSEYKKNLESYTKEKRAEKKCYKPDKYLKNETPAERYYKEMFDNNNSLIFPEKYFDNERLCKELYSEKKKHLKNDINKVNDEISDNKINPKKEKLIYIRKKNNWTQKNSGGYQYFYIKKNPVNNSKINKQINLQSNLFQDNINNKDEKSMILSYEKIKSRLEEEKNKELLNNTFHISHQNKKLDLADNDRTLFGAIHSKWEKSNIDWFNPQTELMFGNQVSKDLNKSFGTNGPTPLERKLNQLADTKNMDTITEVVKESNNKIEKPISQNEINGVGLEKVEKILEKIPELKQEKKFKIKMNTTTSLFNTDKDLEQKVKTMSNFYTNPIQTKKKNKEVTAKIGVNKDNKNNVNKEKTGHDFSEYVLNYDTKGQFEKFGENEIQKLFAKYGVHIYDVHKNMFNKKGYNTIQFKVRDNKDSEDNLNKKINEIEQNLAKNYKVKITKEKTKDVKINNKNFMTNPGSKVGVFNENIDKNKDVKFKKINDAIKDKKRFSREFVQVNHAYKKSNLIKK